jgi:plasmid stabilization system protein ParE
MAIITSDNLKPATITNRCLKMLSEAVKYLKDNFAETQAEIMNEHFFDTVRVLERMPGIGTKYKNGMRKMSLGKFRRYNIYYRIKESEIEIVGIWHTSRGTEFED